MNEKIIEAIDRIREVLKECSCDNDVSFELFLSYGECEWRVNSRTPESLKLDGVSMRNFRGEFIKQKL